MSPPAMAPPSMLDDEVSVSEPSPVRNCAVVERVDRKEECDGREGSSDDGGGEEKRDDRDQTNDTGDETSAARKRETPSNEYVLVIAFVSFLVFVLVQVAFAVIANSRSMLADSEAMMVDAATYLFNFVAERVKRKSRERGQRPPEPNPRCRTCLLDEAPGVDGAHAARPVPAHEHEPQGDERSHNLYLELIPPAVSVLALTVVTSVALRNASATLHPAPDQAATGPVNLTTMLAFSSANLLLDIVNVFCFSRIKKNLFGLENLNVCSAWTHVVADTMRSVAVLLAAGFAKAFPTIPPAKADAVAAVVVSAIILVTVIRLVQGLILTAMTAFRSRHDKPPSAPPYTTCHCRVEPVDG